jgi:GntR family transcriptional regulator/MocR family aminotransferase
MRQAEEKELGIMPRPEGVSRQAWLYSEIRSAILNGQLPVGTRLPASRDLAKQQNISRGTVLAVFAQLAAEGYVDGHVGRGTFVSASIPQNRCTIATAATSSRKRLGGLSTRGLVLTQTPFKVEGRPDPARPFRPSQPDLKLFPFAQWNRIAARRARLSQKFLLSDAESRGYLPLRQVIAERLRYSMRIRTNPEQIAIVGSMQQAFDICSRLLLEPGDKVWMEDPGYPGACRIFQSNGASVVGVPVDADGIDITAGIRLAKNARLAYVTASRQTPLGMSLSLDRRLALLRWADEVDAIVIEDDYDSEYRFSGHPLAALKSLDKSERVIYTGTFSKLLFPSLRLAYIVLPDWLTEPFASALSVTCRHMSLLPQVVLHEFMAEGYFGRHIRRMRTIYGERANIFQEAVSSRLGGLLTLPAMSAGIDSAVFLHQGVDDHAVTKALVAAGIETRPLSAYKVVSKPPAGLILGFAPFERNEILAGSETMSRVLENMLNSRPSQKPIEHNSP